MFQEDGVGEGRLVESVQRSSAEGRGVDHRSFFLICRHELFVQAALFGREAQQFFIVEGNTEDLGQFDADLSAAASEIAEEYRPGNPRTMTDEEVKEKLREIAAMYEQTVNAIRRYEAENP